jgi:uncharacterized protein (TIGR03000 family)
MMKRTIFAVATVTFTAASAAPAGYFDWPRDFSLAPYNGMPMYSYNMSYGYNLPFGGHQLYNPYDPFQIPGRGAYYPRESFYSLPPYGQELYTGPRFFGFRDRDYPPPPAMNGVVVPPLEPVPDAAAATSVTVEVQVPAAAEVWFDGDKTAQTGASRVFHSPALRPGASYLYLVRAKWNEAGHDVEQIQGVTVHAGERVRVSFPVARP